MESQLLFIDPNPNAYRSEERLSLSCNRKFLSFGVFMNLFDEQIEERMFMITLSRRSELHKNIEATIEAIKVVMCVDDL